ncbi:hypothetical protein RND81_13G050500 [Saponaria officinalis]|uniref:Bifunctional inhibitor/plant lipid transfer protein/seed storage helical domain-containing protein n=1 Tax=Saponaria officinalis TaxID=3572 RepID=A0AAW1GX83_SAPOF
MKNNNTLKLITFFFTINILSFTCVTSCNTCVGQNIPNLPNPNPNPNYPSPSTGTGHCPKNALKLGVCAKVLNGPVDAVIGTPPTEHCCSVIEGLLDLEVALCFCTAIKANILGLHLDIPIVLNLLLNVCGKQLPSDFICA